MVYSPSSRRRLAAVAVVVALAGAACADDNDDAGVNNDPAAANATTTVAPSTTAAPVVIETPDIVGTALRAGAFSQLAGMVIDAGLLDTLRSPGPFTVFAPTDAAFDKVPLDALHGVQDNPDTLKTVLTYHVVEGALKAADLKDGELKTVAGVPLTVSHSGSDVLINGKKIATADIEASNGIVHVMGDVLLPPG